MTHTVHDVPDHPPLRQALNRAAAPQDKADRAPAAANPRPAPGQLQAIKIMRGINRHCPNRCW